jgi:hypothetical protein
VLILVSWQPWTLYVMAAFVSGLCDDPRLEDDLYENISRSVVTDNLWFQTRSEICSMERFTFGRIYYKFRTSGEKNASLLHNQNICIKYMVRTQLYIFTQNSTYNYMFRPCILAIVRLYYKLNPTVVARGPMDPGVVVFLCQEDMSAFNSLAPSTFLSLLDL